MKKWILIISCLLVVLFTGCEEFQKLFGGPGKISLSSGSNEEGLGSQSVSTNFRIASENQYPYILTFTIEKVEISKDGYNWVTILNSSVEINTEDWHTPVSGGWAGTMGTTLTTEIEPGEGNYTAVRIYFGPNITANCYETYISTISEITRTDFNTKIYPIVIYNRECQYIKDNYPSGWDETTNPSCESIPVEKGTETKLKITIDADLIVKMAVSIDDSDWAYLRDRLDTRNFPELDIDIMPDGPIGVVVIY